MSAKNKTSYRYTSDFYRKVKRLKCQVKNEQNSPVFSKSSAEVSNTIIFAENTDRQVHCPSDDEQILQDDEIHRYHINDEKILDSEDEFDVEERAKLNDNIDFVDGLRHWALLHKLTISAVTDLLVILKTHKVENLPKDGRTLLCIHSAVEIVPMGTGNFWYNGIKHNLFKSIYELKNRPSRIELLINIDGMSPFSSSPKEFWPISFMIYGMDIPPMYAGIYYGHGKPPLESYLEQFVDEMNDLLKNGLIIDGCKIFVELKCFVCDTPARVYLKGTPYFNASKSSCIKCTVEGQWDKKGRHMSYPKFDCPRRTDSNFRNQVDPDHHVKNSPLTKIASINMVDQFIIADSLHLLDLGVMRKCLSGWCNGSFNFRSKLRAAEIEALSNMLIICDKRRPKEIQRNIRSLKFLKYWKGTEYRVLLLYVGIVVFKDVLSKEVYEHFLLLSTASTILSCKTYSSKFIDIADHLIKAYLEGCIDIYGIDSISSNFHNLCHLVEDVKKFGCLSEISSYPFENSLGQLKSLIRSGKAPLTQIAKRVIQYSTLQGESKMHTSNNIYIKKKQSNCNEFKEIYFGSDFMLGNDNRNGWFMTKEKNIVSFLHAIYNNGDIFIFGAPLENTHDFCTTPFNSSNINIYATRAERFERFDELQCKFLDPKYYSLKDVKCKLFSLCYKEVFVFLPLLHTLDIKLQQ